MRARDIMTTDIATLPPDASLSAIASLLAERGISGAPVVGRDGTLLGIVTESDIMRRIAAERDRPPGWFAGLFGDDTELAHRYARSHGQTASDLMTVTLETVGPDATLPDIAELFETHDIRRVPVLEAGRLLGVVSRADLLKAILAPEKAPDAAPDDAAIRAELQRRLREEPWVDRTFLHATVKGGVVTLSGFARNEEKRRALKVLAESVAGVRAVHLDLAPPPPFMLGSG
jgi:CBS domain-containing protein